MSRLAAPPSQVATDLRACLTAIGPGDDVLGGVALLGLRLPGLDLTIDAVLVLSRGVFVLVGVDLPDPALRLDAPIDGPWLVDGWQLVRSGGSDGPGSAGRPGSPVDDVLAATSAVAARLQAPGAPALPVHAVAVVGPYVANVVQPAGDPERGLRVLVPSARALVSLAGRLGAGVPRCSAAQATALVRVLAPAVGTLDLTAEGF